jgi:hypothetical protein
MILLPRLLTCSLLVALACSTPLGCSRVIGSSGGMRSTGFHTGNTLGPQIRTVAYADLGKGEADVYLTDLTEAQLDPSTPFDELSGSIIHLRLFLKPKAGRTPIESTASTAIIRHAVLVNGAVGIYGGGGFVFPRGDAGDTTLGGSVSNGSMKLVRASGDFVDRLGPAQFAGNFRARLNPELAERIAVLLADAEGFSDPVADMPVIIPEPIMPPAEEADQPAGG